MTDEKMRALKNNPGKEIAMTDERFARINAAWDAAASADDWRLTDIEWTQRRIDAVRKVAPGVSSEEIVAARSQTGQAAADAQAILERVLDRFPPLDRTLQ